MALIQSGILQRFGLKEDDYAAEQYGTGLINDTFRLRCQRSGTQTDYILQKINTQIFPDPYSLVQNHRTAADYLSDHHPDYFFPAPKKTVDNKVLLEWNQEYWRMMPFVSHTVSLDKAHNPKQAYEAAKQFGKLAHNLSGIDLTNFNQTIRNFHNLSERYNNFQQALSRADSKRQEQARELTDTFQRYSGVRTTYEKLKTGAGVPDRLMHHDTKINNVLLDQETHKGVCVIDFDTLMPGKIISDLGDMVRTYVSPVSEEETDFNKITIREAYYDALMHGYLSELGDDLSKTEKNVLFYAGEFMIYMQGLRFLTDYLEENIYYPVKYPLQNLKRAKNQLVLLENLYKKEATLRQIINRYL